MIMEKVVVGIPVYTNNINCFEKIALRQVVNILNKYPIVFIAPQSLKIQYGKDYACFSVERFSDEYFKNTYSYSKLLLSVEFYQRFAKYKFLLIHQLDAFVFSDRLTEFCNLGYDYIGGPMGYVATKNGWKTRIGNGGLSLRKISACIDLLKRSHNLLLTHKKRWHWYRAEDQFFCFCANHAINEFYAASVDVGLDFSFSSDVKKCYIRNHKKLPFGCHAWYKTDFNFYKPFVASYGYTLSNCAEGGDIDRIERMTMIVEYLCKRYLRQKDNKQYLRMSLEKYFGPNVKYIIFGAGNVGELCLQMMRKDGIKPIAFWDNAVGNKGMCMQSIPIMEPRPSGTVPANIRIIVALRECCTDAVLDDIEDQLIRLGFERNKIFVRFFYIEKDVAYDYCKVKGLKFSQPLKL